MDNSISGPPDDPRLKELWSALAQEGLDPDDVLENAARSATDAIDPDQWAAALLALYDVIETHEHVWVYAEPESFPDVYDYRVTYTVVEWDEESEMWNADGWADRIPEKNSAFSDAVVRVAAEESRESEESLLARTVTGLEREEIPSILDVLAQNIAGRPVELRWRLQPDDGGELYELTYEFIEWDGDEWVSVG